MVLPFQNVALTDFSDPAARDAFRQALQKVRGELGRHYPLVIGGRLVDTAERIFVTNPAQPDELIGTTARAGRAEADAAVAAAEAAFADWSRVDPVARARVLWKAAAILRRRRHELSAVAVLEIGQAWGEADAQTAEAIDFLEYYGREMARLATRQPITAQIGEDNDLSYVPLGVGLAIPPWNFPLAILVGTVTAPVVAGNTVIVKPASTTPIVAAWFIEILAAAGLPPGVVNYLPGPGGAVGEYLVTHPRTRFINFTGSQAVGLRINELAAKTQPGQNFIKRVAVELGGKNAMIIDSECDLDDAVRDAVTSAYGFQGQKCSASSRMIVLADVYDEFVTKFVAASRAVRQGSPADPDNFMGPVADPDQFRKVLAYIEIGKGEGRLMCGGEALPGAPAAGYFIQPTVFADVPPDAVIAQEEIFGPVVAIIRARDFDQAIAIANDTVYGLTGGVYSRNRRHLEQARAELHVGNLYLNRKITGALVGAQPFGGFALSGTNAKAGGPDYLKLFMLAKATAERL